MKKINYSPMALYDKWLIVSTSGLIIIGLMMVASSSVMVSTRYYDEPFHFLLRQICYLSLGLGLAFAIVRTNMRFWQNINVMLILISLVLLLLVLIPGIGQVVNGSRRWIHLGPIGVQVSELTKMSMVLYLSGYLVRHKAHVEANIFGFIKPMLMLSLVAFLLLMEPDFGATVVITATVMAMLFLSGVKIRYYVGLVLMVACALTFLAISSSYRMTRLTAFLNPWADQFKSGYQLTQSLIAFGRGGWFGSGLGEGVQKLFYLPESHTDFLFAVLAEELGLMGILLVMALYVILVIRGLSIGNMAFRLERFYSAYVAYGITFWLGFQAIINMGVNSGLLPTKGLTLPFMSYGGASIVVNCMVAALLLRIDHENRREFFGL